MVDLTDILMLFAIATGPLLGAWLTRHLDGIRAKRDRRMDVFRTLMRTRRTPMWPEHVGALNLVEIEFRNTPEVLEAFKKMFKHLGEAHARFDDEVTHDQSDEERQKRDLKHYQRLNEERQQLLSVLLHVMAKKLGFRIEQLEIFSGGYSPQGWGNIELKQEIARDFAVDLSLGKRVLPVGLFNYVNVAATRPQDLQETPDQEEVPVA